MKIYFFISLVNLILDYQLGGISWREIFIFDVNSLGSAPDAPYNSGSEISLRKCCIHMQKVDHVPRNAYNYLAQIGPGRCDCQHELYTHEFHEACHSVTFIVLVNSHQR